MKELSRNEMKNVRGGKVAPCYYDCPITETYSNGTSYKYTIQVSGSDPNTTAKNYASSVVANGDAQAATAGTCGTTCTPG